MITSTIRVRLNEFDEYEVPAPTAAEIYYTDDRDDAIATARRIHGTSGNDESVQVAIRRGTYTAEEA